MINMIKKGIYILILSVLTILAIAIVITVQEMDVSKGVSSENIEIQTTPTPFVVPTATKEDKDYQVIIELSNEEITPEPIIETTPTATIAVTPKITATQIVTPQSADITPKPTVTPKPINTPSPTDTPLPTAKPTNAPDYTLNQESFFISEVLRGVNNERDFEGVPHVYLCDELTELSELHAIAMALKDEDSFHSNYFYVESVRSGVYINGFMEGVGASGHATQLAMDEHIIRIGVGSAISKTGKVFTCVLGARDPSIYN